MRYAEALPSVFRRKKGKPARGFSLQKNLYSPRYPFRPVSRQAPAGTGMDRLLFYKWVMQQPYALLLFVNKSLLLLRGREFTFVFSGGSIAGSRAYEKNGHAALSRVLMERISCQCTPVAETYSSHALLKTSTKSPRSWNTAQRARVSSVGLNISLEVKSSSRRSSAPWLGVE